MPTCTAPLLTEPVSGRCGRRRAVHAQRGIQHDVRSRRHRRRDHRARTRRCCRRREPARVVLDSPAGPIRAGARDRPRVGGRIASIASRSTNVPRSCCAAGVHGDGRRTPGACRRRVRRRVLCDRRREAAGMPVEPCTASGAASHRHGDQARDRSGPCRGASARAGALKGIYGTIFTGPPHDARAPICAT